MILPWIPRDDPTVGESVADRLVSNHELFWRRGRRVVERLDSGMGALSNSREIFRPPQRHATDSTLTFLLIAGWSLAQWNYAILVFQLLIAGAVVMRVFSLRWQWISPARARKHGSAPALPLREQLQIVLRSRSLLIFIAFGAVWSFAANCFGPFYHVFMFEQLRFTAFEVGHAGNARSIERRFFAAGVGTSAGSLRQQIRHGVLPDPLAGADVSLVFSDARETEIFSTRCGFGAAQPARDSSWDNSRCC